MLFGSTVLLLYVILLVYSLAKCGKRKENVSKPSKKAKTADDLRTAVNQSDKETPKKAEGAAPVPTASGYQVNTNFGQSLAASYGKETHDKQ